MAEEESEELKALKGTILLGVCLPEQYDAKLAIGYYGYTRAMHKPPVSDVCFKIKLLWSSVWGDEVLH